jgi:Rad3-related DNA helicase
MSEAHLVIADYWWLFSQMTQENSWLVRAGFSPTDTIVIIDEAHNLPARVRGELDVDEATARLKAEIAKVPFEVQCCLTPIISAVQLVPRDIGISPSALLPRAGGESMVRDALKKLSSDEPEVAESRLLEQMLRLLLHSDEEVVIYRTEGGHISEGSVSFASRKERFVLRLGTRDK